AVSPPICTSAVRIVPQVKPSAKSAHWARLPEPDGSIGRLEATDPSDELTIRKPKDFVSSSTLSMVWHADAEPGAQTVTVTVGLFGIADPPGLTTAVTWLSPLGAGLLGDALWLLPPPPPPQPAINETASAAAAARSPAFSQPVIL